uniref:NADH-ubiquinone oxidoreductase chain 5 n=1 Tax=Protaeolidiella atra TaxID=1154746 RepID=A0A7S6VHV3_9GAST|nr:NADH dehydrogenase subunit 5 [Protaeolidiella atra]QOW38669.1 NADH dehydrogenase subunit 5 [Protaeolidiella atra]
MLLFCYSAWMFLLGFLFMSVSKTQILEFELFSLSTIPFSISFILDKVSVSFSMVVTLISGSVFFFADNYMDEDPFKNRFIWILLSFVVSMNLLIFSGSVFFLLLGWDGLGITSFALIIYYESKESQMAGFQTLMINRLGDVIIVLSCFLFCCSGQFTIFAISDQVFYGSSLICLLFLASLTKSAQFPFSSWLPAAMAAPTPVSALVHSSTLVTAGIFMVIRLSYSMKLSESVCSGLLMLGSITCLLGGWAATFENDIKKVIALSTLSQLGVMVFSLGMNFPSLGLFHLYTHALFKALLFLAAGHILMMTFGSQDVREMGGLGLSMPFTALMFSVSSLCLIGAPFMSAFYSKHLVLELMLFNPLNFISVLTMLVATIMTAKYVFRTLKGVVWGKSSASLISGCSNVYTFFPVIILGFGAVMGGEFISSVDVSTLEYVFIPSSSSKLVNGATILGISLGLMSIRMEIKSFSLSTLFFLTPLIYGSPKIISNMISMVGVLDYGWLEPYFIIKTKAYSIGSNLSQQTVWPNSRLMFCLTFCFIFIIFATVFSY